MKVEGLVSPWWSSGTKLFLLSLKCNSGSILLVVSVVRFVSGSSSLELGFSTSPGKGEEELSVCARILGLIWAGQMSEAGINCLVSSVSIQ